MSTCLIIRTEIIGSRMAVHEVMACSAKRDEVLRRVRTKSAFPLDLVHIEYCSSLRSSDIATSGFEGLLDSGRAVAPGPSQS
jgi:hypothetical protein